MSLITLGSYTYCIVDNVDQLKEEVARLKTLNKTNSVAVINMREQLYKANEEITYRKEIINEIIKAHPDWCNTELPFDFNSMCKSKDSILPSTRTTTK